jgi:hypothetical protein
MSITTGYQQPESPFRFLNFITQESFPPQLSLRGEIDTPTPNYQLEINTQRIDVIITLIAPDGIQPQVIATMPVEVGLGHLEPGEYIVAVHIGRKDADGSISQAQLINTTVIHAVGLASPLFSNLPESWSAWIDAMPSPDQTPPTLHVKGQVDVHHQALNVSLQRAVPQGFNPAILILDIVTQYPTRATDGIRDLHYSEPVETGQYESIHIRIPDHEDVIIETITIAH